MRATAHEQSLGPRPACSRAATSSLAGRDHSRPCSGTPRRARRHASSCGRRSWASGASGPGTQTADGRARDRRRPARARLRARRHAPRSSSNTVVEWVLADLAVLSCGGVSNGIYPTDAAAQVEYLCADSRTTVLFVEDDEQLDKALEVRERLPRLAQDRRVRHRGPARLPTTRSVHQPRRPARARPRPRRDASAAQLDAARRRAAGPRTWRSWSTPRAPPASPRARCTRTRGHRLHGARLQHDRRARTRTTSGCASCRCATSPSASAASTSPSTPARCSTSSRTPRRCRRTCARSRRRCSPPCRASGRSSIRA